jgi:hypothetical protein
MTPGFHDCDDEGSDNLPMLIVPARLRPLDHRPPEHGTTDFGGKPVKNLEVRVEVTSVARLTPSENFGRREPGDTADFYDATVSPRVDTLTVTVTEYQGDAERWSVCDPYGQLPEIESPYWLFVTRPSPWLRVVRWPPESQSWPGIRALADSIRRTTR